MKGTSMGKDVMLCSFVAREAIVPSLVANDRNGVIRELVESLVKAGVVEVDLAEEVIAEVVKREMRGSTGFGKGVAVPHGKHARLKKIVAVIGRSAVGVDFASLDKQPVYSFVLLLSPISEPEMHLAAMNVIFRNLQVDMFRKFLRQADTQQKIWDLLEESDQAVHA
jgi:PTS system fructose-specific IIA component/PTS system nitrogen regulatory IIA component